jgi:2-polyprenyl-3-methyl-5-hydroxy-6-metoxy-1,4-benzoquinol methylase
VYAAGAIAGSGSESGIARCEGESDTAGRCANVAGVPAAPEIVIDAAREQQELRDYLGDAYDHERLMTHAHQLEHELAAVGDEQRFYRTSEAYLYDLTAFAMTATKRPYLEDLVRLVPAPARVLDYGCGIGSDGLLLLELGYRVEFADFANPSTRYLAWRLERRGLSAPIHDLDAGAVPSGFDAAFAFDVIEHVDDPFALLESLERRARLVVVNFLEPAAGEASMHRVLPVPALLDHALARGLRHYRRYHGRSHLVAYAPAATGLAGRLRARVALFRGQLTGLSSNAACGSP